MPRPPAASTAGPPPRSGRVLLLLHLLTAVGLVGLAVALSVLGVAGLNGADPETVYPAMHRIARTALVPLGALALVIGVSQALVSGHGLVRQGWVAAKLAILILLVGAAAVVAVPGLGRAAAAAMTPGAMVTPAQQVVATVVPLVALVLFTVAAVLGVFRPQRRPRG